MLFVMLRQRIVERCTDPASPNYMKVTKMFSRPVEGFMANDIDITPRVGEIIRLGENQAYDVISVVHTRRRCTGLWHPEVIVEVVPHVPKHSYNTGGYSFEEDWPLISDLDLECDDE